MVPCWGSVFGRTHCEVALFLDGSSLQAATALHCVVENSLTLLSVHASILEWQHCVVMLWLATCWEYLKASNTISASMFHIAWLENDLQCTYSWTCSAVPYASGVPVAVIAASPAFADSCTHL